MATGTLSTRDTTSLDDRMCRACRVAARRRAPSELSCRVCGRGFERLLRSGEDPAAVCCSRACGGELARRLAAERLRVFRPPTASAERSRRRRARLSAVLDEQVVRAVVFERDGWVCHLCGGTIDPGLRGRHPMAATIDHVVPLARGGRHSYGNVKAAHLRCNSSRGDRDVRRAVCHGG